MDLLGWWNLVFVLPFVAALMYLLFQAFGVVSVGSGPEADADVDVDADADADIDADMDADMDADADIDHDFGHDMGIEHATEFGHHMHHEGPESSALVKALSFLGVGKVPISLVAMSFCFIWGFSGWASNVILSPVLRYPAIYFWPSLAIALFASLVFTNLLVRGLSKVMPSTESYGTRSQHLLGKRARALYTITNASGCVRLRDDYGNLLDVSARVLPDEEPIPAGDSVVMFRYSGQAKTFYVKPDLLGDHPPAMPDEFRKEEL